MEKSVIFLSDMVAAFFARTSPVSSMQNPAAMKTTTMPEIINNIVSATKAMTSGSEGAVIAPAICAASANIFSPPSCCAAA